MSDFFSKYNRKTVHLITFTAKIFDEKPHFLRSVHFRKLEILRDKLN